MAGGENKTVVIFDMDGTLTRPVLDFDAIREEIGVEREPLLEAMERMAPAQRARAEAILHRHEESAAGDSTLQPGAAEVVAAVRSAGMAAALMTRNSDRSVETFKHRHGIEFDLTWTRYSGPMKPSPEPVLEICRRLGATAAQSWVVGDFRFDIDCGRAAGATTVLLWDRDRARPDWSDQADHVIAALPELPRLLGIAAPAAR